MDHLVLIGLNVFEYVLTFEVLDGKKGSVERDSDLVEDYCQRGSSEGLNRAYGIWGCSMVVGEGGGDGEGEGAGEGGTLMREIIIA
jgi:hypothetical protein